MHTLCLSCESNLKEDRAVSLVNCPSDFPNLGSPRNRHRDKEVRSRGLFEISGNNSRS